MVQAGRFKHLLGIRFSWHCGLRKGKEPLEA